MHHATLVSQGAVAADKGISGDRRSKRLHAKHVLNDLLSRLVNLRVHQSDVVIACNNVSECGKALINALNAHALGQ